MALLTLIVALVILGIVAWLAGKAKFIDEDFKSLIKYALLVVGAIILITFLLNLIGGGDAVLQLK